MRAGLANGLLGGMLLALVFWPVPAAGATGIRYAPGAKYALRSGVPSPGSWSAMDLATGATTPVEFGGTPDGRVVVIGAFAYYSMEGHLWRQDLGNKKGQILVQKFEGTLGDGFSWDDAIVCIVCREGSRRYMDVVRKGSIDASVGLPFEGSYRSAQVDGQFLRVAYTREDGGGFRYYWVNLRNLSDWPISDQDRRGLIYSDAVRGIEVYVDRVAFTKGDSTLAVPICGAIQEFFIYQDSLIFITDQTRWLTHGPVTLSVEQFADKIPGESATIIVLSAYGPAVIEADGSVFLLQTKKEMKPVGKF